MNALNVMGLEELTTEEIFSVDGRFSLEALGFCIAFSNGWSWFDGS
jgi:hypothetical protein